MSSSGTMTGSSGMGTGSSRKETERVKLIQEKCHTLLSQMLRDEDNKYCVDCDAKGPRWASWNLGVFLCIRCAGIHRNLGVHISRVKSVNLDTWTPEQVISLQQMGNSRARAVYEAQLPDGFRRPQTDTALESFIRAKYEHKKYLAREWVPPSPPKVDWAKEIDDELERQKRKKKAAHVNASIGLTLLNNVTGDEKKTTMTGSSNSVLSKTAAPLPAPLPKPKTSNPSPKNPQRHIMPTTTSQTNESSSNHQHSNDLLGLSSPTKSGLSADNLNDQFTNRNAVDSQYDAFSCFLSATPSRSGVNTLNSSKTSTKNTALVKEEEDFFKQHTLNQQVTSDKEKSMKLTKDYIMALYGQTATNPPLVTPVMGAFLQQQHQQHSLPQQQAAAGLFNAAGGLGTYNNLPAAGVVTSISGQQQQFMTPPNSVSMYNTPVMTAPAAFTAPPLTGVHMGAPNLGFAGQFPTQIGFPQQTSQGSLTGTTPGIMNPAVLSVNNNSMLYPGLTGSSLVVGQPHTTNTGTSPFNPILMDGYGSAGSLASSGSTGSAHPSTATTTTNLQQQFSNLNIANGIKSEKKETH